jgi:hypothetical protein
MLYVSKDIFGVIKNNRTLSTSLPGKTRSVETGNPSAVEATDGNLDHRVSQLRCGPVMTEMRGLARLRRAAQLLLPKNAL